MKIKGIVMLFLVILSLNNDIIVYTADNLKCKIANQNNQAQYIKIYLKDLKIEDEKVKIDEDYIEFATLTFDVINTSLEPIELSQMDFEFYQSGNLKKTFVKTNEGIYGFLGRLDSGETKEVKICVELDNSKENLLLVIKKNNLNQDCIFENIDIF